MFSLPLYTLDTVFAICITNAQKLSIQVSVLNCGGGPVNFTHKLMIQEQFRIMWSFVCIFTSFISAAGMDTLEPTAQLVNLGKKVGHNEHYQEAPVGNVNQPVSDNTVLTSQVGNHSHWLEMEEKCGSTGWVRWISIFYRIGFQSQK